MEPFTIFILFVFGLAIGSFLNVVAMRYDGERFLLSTKAIGGRSHCAHCGETLQWFELLPLFSYLIQAGRCRRCKAPLSIQYPIVELLSALIFIFVPWEVCAMVGGATIAISASLVVIAALWVLAFEALLVMTLIDIRLGIIPDEINIFLVVIGVALAIVSALYFGAANHSFLGPYAAIFGAQGSMWVNKIIATVFGGVFFALLIAVTRGKGMGMGDLKLAIPLGLLFGWPDIIFVMMYGFVAGALVGLISIMRGKNTMKGTVPFGPFLAIGAVVVFFWGFPIVNWYFSALGIR